MIDLAADELGIVLRRDALAMGIDDNALRRAVHAGLIVRIRQGVYVLTHIWDVADATAPNRAATLRMLSGAVQDLALSADGRWLVISSHDRLAMVWDLGVLPAVVANPIGVACQLVGSGLSPEEWKQYVPGIPYQPLCQ